MDKPFSRQMNFVSVCNKCQAKCCRNARPPLTHRRIRIIEDYLQSKGILPKICEGEYSFPDERTDGICSLLDVDTGRCVVHEVKPETCVAGPITFDVNRIGGTIEWYLKTEAICPLAGILSRNRPLLLEHFLSARRELLCLVDELEGSELKAILRIEEEDTVKIGEERLPDSVLKKLR